MTRVTIMGAAFLIAAISPALAQTGGAAPDTDLTKTGSLSHKLDQTNGVIHPKGDIDPGMTKPAPDVDTRSPVVVPPAGNTNGAGGAQPK